MSEYELQCKAARILDALGVVWLHTPNEGKRHPATGARLKRAGLKKGVPDILILDRQIAIELKYGKNKLTPHQKHWLERLRNCGWTAVVCRSVDEVIETIGGK